MGTTTRENLAKFEKIGQHLGQKIQILARKFSNIILRNFRIWEGAEVCKHCNLENCKLNIYLQTIGFDWLIDVRSGCVLKIKMKMEMKYWTDWYSREQTLQSCSVRWSAGGHLAATGFGRTDPAAVSSVAVCLVLKSSSWPGLPKYLKCIQNHWFDRQDVMRAMHHFRAFSFSEMYISYH